MAILVTGGAGFIGSHTCVELLNAGYEVVVLDNLVNASEKSLERVKAITGKEVTFYKGDILDRTILNEIFEKEKIDSCIHFAGLKAVGESVCSKVRAALGQTATQWPHRMQRARAPCRTSTDPLVWRPRMRCGHTLMQRPHRMQ